MERKLNVSRTHRARGIAPAVESGGGWRPGGWQRPEAELGIEQCQKDEQCTTSDDSGSHDLSQLSFFFLLLLLDFLPMPHLILSIYNDMIKSSLNTLSLILLSSSSFS